MYYTAQRQDTSQSEAPQSVTFRIWRCPYGISYSISSHFLCGYKMCFWLVSDLSAEICSCQTQDEFFVPNYPLTPNNKLTRAMTNLGLCSPIVVHIDELGQSLPHIRSSGSCTIDGIYVTNGIPIFASGFASHNNGLIGCDHVCTWADLMLDNINGYHIPPFVEPLVQGLQLGIPKVVTSYQDTFHLQCPTHNL